MRRNGIEDVWLRQVRTLRVYGLALLDTWYPESAYAPLERAAVYERLAQYIRKLRRFARQPHTERGSAPDFVTCGSLVTYIETASQKEHRVMLTYRADDPEAAAADAEAVCFMSPLGLQLLGAPLGKLMTLQFDGGLQIEALICKAAFAETRERLA